MSNLSVFSFEKSPVRTVLVSGAPWFSSADVGKILQLSNIRASVALLDDDEKGVNTIDTPGGKQEISIVSESGLYALIFKSRRPEAKKFRRWVTSEVLPAIRKTGSYSAATLNIAVFGCTAAEYKNTNPEPKGNMRDNASIEQLLILNQLESQNALLIRQGWPKPRRLRYLCEEAQRQMKSLTTHGLPGADELKKIP
jgi:prophage antirepressor-like protein